MLSARNQENVVHDFQTAAAAKPLNQQGKAAPKTPANQGARTVTGKVPLRQSDKEDENKIIGGRSTKAEKYGFATPAAPRDRAPLGTKTTNAKATAFQTPAPLTGATGLPQTQRRSASTRKPKLKIHQAEEVEAAPDVNTDDEEEPEIEYCPPKITELSDITDDPNAFGPGKTFPQFEGENMFRGWYSLYCNPIGDDGLCKFEREARVRREKAWAEMDQELQDACDRDLRLENITTTTESDAVPKTENEENHGRKTPKGSAQRGHTSRNAPSTLTSRSAAAALSTKPQPRFAQPTAAATAKKSAALPTKGAPARNNIGTVASHTTIGYSKGRKVSSSLRDKTPSGNDAKMSQDRTLKHTETESELINQLLKSQNPNDSDNDTEGQLFPGLRRDWFAEEISKPFVLDYPPPESEE